MSEKIYIARRNCGLDFDTVSKYDFSCFKKMRELDESNPENAFQYPFIDIVSFELKDPKVEVTFVIPETHEIEDKF